LVISEYLNSLDKKKNPKPKTIAKKMAATRQQVRKPDF